MYAVGRYIFSALAFIAASSSTNLSCWLYWPKSISIRCYLFNGFMDPFQYDRLFFALGTFDGDLAWFDTCNFWHISITLPNRVLYLHSSAICRKIWFYLHDNPFAMDSNFFFPFRALSGIPSSFPSLPPTRSQWISTAWYQPSEHTHTDTYTEWMLPRKSSSAEKWLKLEMYFISQMDMELRWNSMGKKSRNDE